MNIKFKAANIEALITDNQGGVLVNYHIDSMNYEVDITKLIRSFQDIAHEANGLVTAIQGDQSE